MREIVVSIYIWLLLTSSVVRSQDFKDTNAFDANYFTGNIMAHSPDLHHLITGHPEGVMLAFSKQTHGSEEWHKVYNYPDYGVYFLHQDFKNQYLGQNFAIGLHYNFYFLKRNLQFRVSQGIAMTTKPHDNQTNYKNGAFGSRFMENTNFLLSYKKENIIDRFGLHAGLMFTHFSNGRIKSPNSGINTYNVFAGVNYNLNEPVVNKPDSLSKATLKFTEPIKFNAVLRTGVNESLIVGSGQKPFYHIGFYADKRLSRKSAIQFGTELFLTNSFKSFINYKAAAYPESNLDPDTDYKRIGIFIGHELFINRLSFEAQVGYYVYKPFKQDIAIYDRVGIKYYFWDHKLFTGVGVKTHGFLAEAMEFAIGIRF